MVKKNGGKDDGTLYAMKAQYIHDEIQIPLRILEREVRAKWIIWMRLTIPELLKTHYVAI